MNQQELEALLRQIAPNNDPGRLEFSESTDTVEVDERANEYAPPTKVKKPVRVLTWVDRGTGQTLVVQADPMTGTYTKVSQGVNPKMQGEPATTPGQQAAAAGASERKPVEGKPGVYVVTTKTQRSDGGTDTESHYEDEGGNRVPTPQANAQVAPSTLNTTSPQYALVGPDGSVTWQPNPNYQNPSPKPISLPNTRTIIWDNGDGTTRTEKNPNYVKPSKIIQNPSDPRKMVNVTEDDNGNPVILPVDDKTTIKPADLPVLQSKYGEIAQGLGALAQELNQRVARQEMTPQERTEAFTAAYKQAETQVSEINSILENSKAIWSGQVNQRGQTLSETQSRRSFASDAAGRAITTGYTIATSAGPGHGKQIAAGVEALMGMQERYAQGMGGFRESPEIGLPPALEQARGIGIPGYPTPGGGAGGPAGPAVGPPAPPPAGTNAIGAGAIGAQPPPAGVPTEPARGGMTPPARPAPLLPPPPPVTGPMTAPTESPVAGMGAALGAADGYAGGPVAGGDAGMWDPMQAMQGMLGQGGDPAWEEAVRRAAGAFGR